MRFGLLGRDISYSLSPRIFEWLFQECGSEGEYKLYDLPPDEVLPFLRASRSRLNGLNVTTPYKTVVAVECDKKCRDADRTGAVNTIHWRDGCLFGENTDTAGFRFALQSFLQGDKSPANVLIAGSGGTARACLAVLADDCPGAAVTVASRTPEETKGLLSQFAVAEFLSPTEAAAKLREYDLVVQATPIGSAKFPGYPLPGSLNFGYEARVMDLIYHPAETAFLATARLCGARTENGLVMLIVQAVTSFNLWTGKSVSVDDAVNKLKRILA